jgi:hypothetical protein
VNPEKKRNLDIERLGRMSAPEFDCLDPERRRLMIQGRAAQMFLLLVSQELSPVADQFREWFEAYSDGEDDGTWQQVLSRARGVLEASHQGLAHLDAESAKAFFGE